MNVLVAMSGGVDSSVAAALLRDEGHRVTGVTLRLWGGESDTGCCSVADVDDARRVARALGIDHHVWNLSDRFAEDVVAPFVADHAAGRTPNPCIECNRHVKFDRLLRRADALGFEAVATGHHARIVEASDGTRRIARGTDPAKDQSYVLYMLGQRALSRTLLPVGALTKAEVRQVAATLGLPTAGKPDSQDVCFITRTGGRASFLAERITRRPARVVDLSGREVGSVDAPHLVTVGQRRGLGLAGGSDPRYVVDVDPAAATVTVGGRAALDTDGVEVDRVVWADAARGGELLVQCSAHGEARLATVATRDDRPRAVTVRWARPERRVAPGQSVGFYDGDRVLGGGEACRQPVAAAPSPPRTAASSPP